MDASSNGTIRTGVYVCHCGMNIAQFVDVPSVVEFSQCLSHVAIARDYQFMCSEPGQELIRKDIAEQGLNRVVVASCSPLMHEATFRRACADAGLNPFLFQMANIREQCSWVTEDKAEATEKARRIIRAAVRRVVLHTELTVRQVPVNPRVMVIGGGIAGIEAALQIADAGKQVVLVEREPSIGGRMVGFDKTFPTLDCAACILTPKMVSVGQHPNIELRTFCEVVAVSGYVGNFKVTIRKKKRYVDVTKCNGCGRCWQECPAVVTPRERVITIEDRLFKEIAYGARDGKAPRRAPMPSAEPVASPGAETVGAQEVVAVGAAGGSPEEGRQLP